MNFISNFETELFNKFNGIFASLIILAISLISHSLNLLIFYLLFI
jgi:hypothetical protein